MLCKVYHILHACYMSIVVFASLLGYYTLETLTCHLGSKLITCHRQG